MKEPIFIKASDIANMLQVSEQKAYKIIRQLNKELSEKGFLTVRGRINKNFFIEKVYGNAY